MQTHVCKYTSKSLAEALFDQNLCRWQVCALLFLWSLLYLLSPQEMETSTKSHLSFEQLFSSSAGGTKTNVKQWQIEHGVPLQSKGVLLLQLGKRYFSFNTARLCYRVGDSCLFITIELFKVASSLVKQDNVSKWQKTLSLKWAFLVSLVKLTTQKNKLVLKMVPS